MWSKIVPEIKRWVSRYLAVTMVLSLVLNNSFVVSAFAAPKEEEEDTATASNAVRDSKVSLKNHAGSEDKVWIAVLSQEAGYDAGDEVCLNIYIKNNTQEVISDGILRYKGNGILEDSGYFEEMDSLYTGQEDAVPEDSLTVLSDTEVKDGQTEVEEEDADNTWLEEEDSSEEDQPEHELTDLTIEPGGTYQAQFYFTIDDSIETIKNQKVTFKFQGETEEAGKIFANEEFYYGVGAMNLLPVELGTEDYFQDSDTEAVRGEIPAGADGRMLLSFDLGDIEDMILEEIMENGSSWEGASPSDGRPASDSQAEKASPAQVASSSQAQPASSSQAEKEGEESGTNPWIKWEGESFKTSKKEQPIVRGLNCEVEAWGVKLNHFRRASKAAEDEYDISTINTFQIDPDTQPGVYYGKVTASYQAKGKSFKSSQGFVLTVTEGIDEQVARVIALIDELPEFEEAAETLAKYEEAEDDEGYAAYYLALSEQVTSVHGEYLALTEAQQEKVTNREKLLMYVEMFGVETLEEKSGASTTPLPGHREESYGGNDIRFMMFNYGEAVNNNGLSGGFDFRGLFNHGTTNELTDQDGYTDNRVRVKPKLEGGYPVFHVRPTVWNRVSEEVQKMDGKSLGYLFGAGGNGVVKYTATNTPLTYEKSNRRFTYNSAENAVDFVFEGDSGEFYLRDYQERGTSLAYYCKNHGKDYYDFFPFTYWNGILPTADQKNNESSFNYDSNEIDYWFGMTMEAKFLQPKDGKIRYEVSGVPQEEEMIFNFSGDDDVWVFIDDVLVLDLGGTHGIVSGAIDFSTGDIWEYLDWGPGDNKPANPTTNIKARFEEAYANEEEKFDKLRWNGDTFANYTEHNIKLFYLERATSCSNCKLEFNLPTLPPNSLMVTKDVTASGEGEGAVSDFIKDSLEYKFRVVKKGGNENNPSDLYLPAGTEYVIWENGSSTNRKGTIGEDGCFTLKSGESAQFDKMIHTEGDVTSYYVEEIMPTDLTGQYAGVEYQVGSNGGQTATGREDQITNQFTTFKSGEMAADESQFVTYFNKVETNKLSTLKITKEQEQGSIFDPNKEFDIQVKLGDQLLEKGTKYQVTTRANSQGIEKEVGEDGVIKLKVGETAEIFKKILSGTEYEIQEIIPNGETFHPSYSGTITIGTGEPENILFESSSEMAKGKFELNSTVHVTVKNKSYDFPGEISIVKQCIGNEETAVFHFNVEEVEFDADEHNGTYEAKGGQLPGTNITVTDENGTKGKILIGYSSGTTGIYYYKVSEQRGEGYDFIYDDSFYIVEMTVKNGSAEVSEVWKNGIERIDKGKELPFTNYKSVPLTVKKMVAGDQPQTGDSFTFTAKITRENRPFTLPQPVEGAGYQVHEDGTVEFSLKHGGSMVLPIPVGADVVITEVSHDGYRVSCSYTVSGQETKVEGDSVSIPGIVAPLEVDVTNTPGILLPDTGGPGLMMFNRYGWMLLLLALMMAGMEVCLYGYSRRKQGEEY